MKPLESLNPTNFNAQLGEFVPAQQKATDYHGDPNALQNGETEVFGLASDHLRDAEISAANRLPGRTGGTNDTQLDHGELLIEPLIERNTSDADEPFGLNHLRSAELSNPQSPVDSSYSSGLRGDGDMSMPPTTPSGADS